MFFEQRLLQRSAAGHALSARMSAKADYKDFEEDGKSALDFDIVKEVTELIYQDPGFGERFETWVDSNAELFDLEADPSEHRLEYTELYQEYQRLLEEQIGDLLDRRKVRVTEFYEILKRAIDEDPEGETAMFANILRHVADYDIFVQMLREAAEKRERQLRLQGKNGPK